MLLPEAFRQRRSRRSAASDRRESENARCTWSSRTAPASSRWCNWGCSRSIPGARPSTSSKPPTASPSISTPMRDCPGNSYRGGDRDARGAARHRPRELCRKRPAARDLHVVVPVDAEARLGGRQGILAMGGREVRHGLPDRFTANMAKRARTRAASSSITCATAAARRRSAPIRRAPAPARRWRRRCSGKRSRRASSPTLSPSRPCPTRLDKLKSDPWAEMPTLRQTIGARIRKEIGI